MSDNMKFVAGKVYRLAGSGCTSIATTITVQNLVLPDGAGTPITMTMFGTIGHFTLEAATSKVEFCSFTGITDNGDDTWDITGVTRGLAFVDPYTNVSANQRTHAGGTTLIFSNSPAFYAGLTSKMNDEAITGAWTFDETAVPRISAAHTYIAGQEEYLVTKRYADSLAIAGAPDGSTTTKGIFEEATLAEIIAGTAAGGTGARLAINPSTFGARLYFGYAADAGVNDTYVITCSPAPAAYTTGMVIQFLANTGNTGACTLNVNALGARNIKVNKDLDPQDGYIKAGQIVTVVYDGTNFQVLSVPGKALVTQSGTEIYAADSVGTDSYAVTIAPVPTLITGITFRIKVGTANTGPATLNVNGGGAIALVKNYNQPLATGDLLAGQIIQVSYDGTSYQLTSPVSQPVIRSNGVFTKNVADASTTQAIAHGLGVIPKSIIFEMNGFSTNGKMHSLGFYESGVIATSWNGFSAGVNQDSGTDTSNIMYWSDGNAGSTYTHTAVISSVDATNINLTWTKGSSPTGNARIAWRAST